ncbi:hypothetical protein V8B97DRAFT_1876521, partial [Scleroderma yunnanense]
HVVPTPSSSAEAYLLLETAHTNCQVWLTQQSLVHQILHHNTLTLQYNCLMLEHTQEKLYMADHFVGQVCTMIRKSGIMAAFKYAMQEDYSPHAAVLAGKIHPKSQYTLDLKFVASIP